MAPSSRREAEAGLRRIGEMRDAEIDLGEAALLLAALERPGLDLDRYRGHLAELADAVAKAGADSAEARAAALAGALAGRYGYAGDDETYDDLQNANLARVIDRRRGLPVSLGILYIQTGRAQGWTVEGLNFPAHFLVRLGDGTGRAILDPFHRGAARSAADLRALLKSSSGVGAELIPEHTAPLGNRAVLLRLQHNIKLRQMRADRVDQAIATLEAMLLFAPQEALLWREAGLLHAHVDNVTAAIAALERFLALSADARLRHHTALLLQRLRTRLN
ncbi:MAG TPA: transglutaminase-like domain-containing protein [Alphaproteobacteria bacterium]|nr:transglutaminase-like domain-containing protein [Alphaproteobacteria bacterium]